MHMVCMMMLVHDVDVGLGHWQDNIMPFFYVYDYKLKLILVYDD